MKTLLEFIFKGTDVLGYEEHLDYDIAQSMNPDFNKAFVRVNIFKQHHEIVSYHTSRAPILILYHSRSNLEMYMF